LVFRALRVPPSRLPACRFKRPAPSAQREAAASVVDEAMLRRRPEPSAMCGAAAPHAAWPLDATVNDWKEGLLAAGDASDMLRELYERAATAAVDFHKVPTFVPVHLRQVSRQLPQLLPQGKGGLPPWWTTSRAHAALVEYLGAPAHTLKGISS